MQQLNEHHAFIGMQKDLPMSLHPINILYNALNIRLTARGDSTAVAVTNEKGTNEITSLRGYILGHCLLNLYLILFIYNYKGILSNNAILRLDLSKLNNNNFYTEIFEGSLDFKISKSIDAIGSYENENVQKVYWTDGYNQPRVVNIIGKTVNGVETFNYTEKSFDFVRELQLNEDVTITKQYDRGGEFPAGVIQYAFTYYTKFGQESNIFYTSPLYYVSPKGRGGAPDEKVSNVFNITVAKPDMNFDYLRIYSIQRTSINGTPIVKRVRDISTSDVHDVYDVTGNRVVISPNYERPKVNNVYVPDDQCSTWSYRDDLISPDLVGYHYFKKSDYPNLVISVPEGELTWGPDTTENSYIGISLATVTVNGSTGYAVFQIDSYGQGSTLQSMTIIRNLSFTDTGTVGNIIDPTELLYKGGTSITANTIEQKDNTLFLGNIKFKRPDARNLINVNRIVISNSISNLADFNNITNDNANNSYPYKNQLEHGLNVAGFNYMDYYRLGVQFQYKDGSWSDPIFISDQCQQTDATFGKRAIFRGVIEAEDSTPLINNGFKKVRGVVVFPNPSDRVVKYQGIICPTLYTNNQKTNSNLQAQSSWFFRLGDAMGRNRPPMDDIDIATGLAKPIYTYLNATDSALYSHLLLDDNLLDNPEKLRLIEVQGYFDEEDKFRVTYNPLSFHSPDLSEDSVVGDMSACYLMRNTGSYIRYRKVFSSLEVQTETPQIGNSASGFSAMNTVSTDKSIITGPLYEDFVVDDYANNVIEPLPSSHETRPVKWFIYPWQREGSLNNDIKRPAGLGTQSAVLKKKILANLRYFNSFITDTGNTSNLKFQEITHFAFFNKTDVSVEKIGDNGFYQGNIDTLLQPKQKYSLYFAFGGGTPTVNDNGPMGLNVDAATPFNSNMFWRTFNGKVENNYPTPNYDRTDVTGLWKYRYHSSGGFYFDRGGTFPADDLSGYNAPNIGDYYLDTIFTKNGIRMKYKSTPHLVLKLNGFTNISTNSLDRENGVYSIVQRPSNASLYSDYYRETMFGGRSNDALKENVWVPCGEPVKLKANGRTSFKYTYGDTYMQRWDCLKTYPFSPDDINQIVEIGSFVLKSHTNCDGRYDRNRGLLNNTNMSPRNFNLLNPVYSQIDNFFSYKIHDDSYYENISYPNEITWTKEKSAGAETDLWTNITLGSTYDMDGSKGEVISINSWKDQLLCFQPKGVSTILFNSRVQIPTSDGVPIEITNSYKVDGYRYVSDGVGCNNRLLIKETPNNIYFIDSISNHLYSIGEGLKDIALSNNMSSWFDSLNWNISRLLYDDVNKDLYITLDLFGDSTPLYPSLCYSETLGLFTSFMDYTAIALIESYKSKVYTLRMDSASSLSFHELFAGTYNEFFGNYKPWNISFISNGIDLNALDIDKTFSTLDYRMDLYNYDNTTKLATITESTFDTILVENEYLDTGIIPLTSVSTSGYYPNHNRSNTQKKYRQWRILIPRKLGSRDRIRNNWCKITLTKNNTNATPINNTLKAILHDINVQYFI